MSDCYGLSEVKRLCNSFIFLVSARKIFKLKNPRRNAECDQDKRQINGSDEMPSNRYSFFSHDDNQFLSFFIYYAQYWCKMFLNCWYSLISPFDMCSFIVRWEINRHCWFILFLLIESIRLIIICIWNSKRHRKKMLYMDIAEEHSLDTKKLNAVKC